MKLKTFALVLCVVTCVQSITSPKARATRAVKMHHSYSQVKSYSPTLQSDSARSDYQNSASVSNFARVVMPNFREGRQSTEENPYRTECPPRLTGHYPYLMDCRQYLNCYNGRGYIQSCAPGTLFNPETSECDYPSKVKCGAAGGRSEQLIEQPKKKHYGEDDSGPQCEADVSGLFIHPADCSKFLNCASGTTYVQDCGPGTLFNHLYKICDWPYNVECGDRPVPVSSDDGNSFDGNSNTLYSGGQRPPSNLIQHTGSASNVAYNAVSYRPPTSHHSSGAQPNDFYRPTPRPIRPPSWSREYDQTVPNLDQQPSKTVPSYNQQGFNQPQNNQQGFIEPQGNYRPNNQNGFDQPQYNYHTTPPSNPRNYQPAPTQYIPSTTTPQPDFVNYNAHHYPSYVTTTPQPNYDQGADQQNAYPSPNRPSYQPYPADSQQISETVTPQWNQPNPPSNRRQHYDQNTYYEDKDIDQQQEQSSFEEQNQVQNVVMYSRGSPSEEPLEQPSTTTERANIQPLYNRPRQPQQQTNHGYYHSQKPDSSAQLANIGTDTNSLSAAMQVLLRPYMNRTGGVKDEDIDRFQKSFKETTLGEASLGVKDPKKEAQALFSSEQNSLSGGQFDEDDDGEFSSDEQMVATTKRAILEIEQEAETLTTTEISRKHRTAFHHPHHRNFNGNHRHYHQHTQHPFGANSFVHMYYFDDADGYTPLHGYPLPTTTPRYGPDGWNQNGYIVPRPTPVTPPVNHDDTNTQNASPCGTSNTGVKTRGCHHGHTPQRQYPHHHHFSPSRFPTKNTFPNIHPNRNFPHHHHHHPSHGFPTTPSTTPEIHPNRNFPHHHHHHPSHGFPITPTTTPEIHPNRNFPHHYYPYYPPQPTTTTEPPVINSDPQNRWQLPQFTPPPHHNLPRFPFAPSNQTAIYVLPNTDTTVPVFLPQGPCNDQQGESGVELSEKTLCGTIIISRDPGSREPKIWTPILPTTTSDEIYEYTTTPTPTTERASPTSKTTTTEAPAPPRIPTTPFRPRYNPNVPVTPPTTTPLGPPPENPNKITSTTPANNPVSHPLGVLPLQPNPRQPIIAEDTCKIAGYFVCGNQKCVSLEQKCDGFDDCGNGEDEKNCANLDYEVRLSSDTGKKNEGRIEVKAYGSWGYVCDDRFGMQDANVVCRELGFPLGASEIRGNSYYSANANLTQDGHPKFLMNKLDCLGNETSLKECPFSGWGQHDCVDEEIAGVVCKIPVMKCPDNYWLCDTSKECIPTGFLCDGVSDCADGTDESEAHCQTPVEIRLVGGVHNSEGRLEIKYRGTWGTVCDDDFGRKEIEVVCKKLGHNGQGDVIKGRFGEGKGQIWLDQVRCNGNESGIEDCTHWNWGEHNCAHTEDVGIRCAIGPRLPNRLERSSPAIFAFNTTDDSDRDIFQFKTSEPILPDKCGEIKVPDVPDNLNHFRVIDGAEAKVGHHPWQAALRVRGQGKSSHWCGAIVISRYHILTAAHCLIGYPKGAYYVRVGDHFTNIDESHEAEAFIENIYIHEDFRKGQHMSNDIAVVLLKSPLKFTDYVQPICLPPKDAQYETGMNCTISGWGSIQSGLSTASYVLREGNVPILSTSLCNMPHIYDGFITEGMFCAGSLDEGIDACEGDSGGPLVCNVNGVNSLYGIISWGQHCGYVNRPGVYTKVAHYRDWIENKMNQTLTVS